MGSISAIRDETHCVLARLHGGLDAPFLTHRLLLVTPDDAEGYVVDLLSSEFQAILQSRAVGSTHAGRDVIEGALIDFERSGQPFRLMMAKNDERQPVSITKDDVMKLVDSGPIGLSGIKNVNNGPSAEKSLHERLYLLLHPDQQSGLANHYEFARTSAYVREPATCAPDWAARLDLGAIVSCGEEHLVCIQPSCGAIRLMSPTQFIFAPLVVDQARFEIVITSPEGKDICLKLNAQASLMRTARFVPDRASGTVRSIVRGTRRVFESTDNHEYVWVADLRTSFAQRMVHRIATNLSRIGLDEFEWQRRLSGG